LDAAGPLTEGSTVVARLKPSYYEASGRFSFYCDAITPVGEGRLLARLVVTVDGKANDLYAGNLLILAPGVEHDVFALQESRMLLTVTGLGGLITLARPLPEFTLHRVPAIPASSHSGNMVVSTLEGPSIKKSVIEMADEAKLDTHFKIQAGLDRIIAEPAALPDIKRAAGALKAVNGAAESFQQTDPTTAEAYKRNAIARLTPTAGADAETENLGPLLDNLVAQGYGHTTLGAAGGWRGLLGIGEEI